ncbi:WD40 repeat-like protein [Suillus brevipes Sb2]|nr:WD40 repeat-like protein [Suillus brevipes Sb2]
MLKVVDVTPNVCLNVRGQRGPARTMRGHKHSMPAFAFFKDGRRVIIATTRDVTLQIWDLQNGELLGGPSTPEGNESFGVTSIAISPDDRRIASGAYKTVIIRDVKSNQMVFKRAVEHTSWVYSVCFSLDGKRLAGGSGDAKIIVWDVETGTVLATLKDNDHSRPVYTLAFSPDGLKLASGSAGIRVWRIDNSELLVEINSQTENVAWSPDSQQLVSVSSDSKTLRCWNSLNGDQIDHCTSHTPFIDSIAISSDMSFITTTSDYKIVQLWTRTTEEHAFEPTTGVESVAISPDGELPVSGDNRGKIWL